MIVSIIALLWILKVILKKSYKIGFSPLHLFALLFIFLVILQLTPLPPKLLDVVSPKTYWLYSETIPGYDGHNMKIKNLEDRFFSLDNTNPEAQQLWKPVSINPYKTKGMLFKIISYFLAFLIVMEHFRSSQKTDKLIKTLLVVGTFQAFYGLLEYLSGHQQIFFYKKIYNLESATGTFVNPNHFAGCLEMILPIAFGMFFYRLRRSRSEPLTFKEKFISLSQPSKLINFLIFLSVIIIFSGLLLSYSRTGIIVCSSSLVFLSLFILFSHRRGKMKLTIIILLVILLVSPFLDFGLNKMKDRFSNIKKEFTPEGSRVDVWYDSLHAFPSFFLFGSGLRTFEEVFTLYASKDRGVRYDFAHNDYIQILIETGAIGFILVLCSLIFLVIISYKKIKKYKNRRQPIFFGLFASFIAILIHEVTDFNLYIYSNGLLFSVVLALILIEANRKESVDFTRYREI